VTKVLKFVQLLQPCPLILKQDASPYYYLSSKGLFFVFILYSEITSNSSKINLGPEVSRVASLGLISLTYLAKSA